MNIFRSASADSEIKDMIRNSAFKWFGLILASSVSACSSSPLSLGTGTDEVVSATNDDDDNDMGNDDTSDDMSDSDTTEIPSDSDTTNDNPCMGPGCMPSEGGCELGGVYYENGQELPETDCNTQWCQDGSIATTLIYCGVSLEECESNLAACRMEGGSMTCAQEYNVCVGQVQPDVDMCQAAVAACIENGEDAMTCAFRYNCDGTVTSPDECETLLAACQMNNGMDCDGVYNACAARMDPAPAGDMCQASIETCIADGESEAACQMRYAGCGSSPVTPQQCESAFAYCQSSAMAVACDETYTACMADAEPLTAAECRAEFETCEANGMSTTCDRDFAACVSYAEE
jgi:hypothetical protein